MPNSATRPDWDIFCKVIDNFGDVGVCWRLARQLTSDWQLHVRLWVDDMETFRALLPEADPVLSIQELHGVEVRRWEAPFVASPPAAVVLETFACRIPDAFIAAMAQQSPRPVWINLDYLSAEAWVAGCHALPSPHPRLPLKKFFFFPGFTRDTGGLLREHDLLARRQQFAASPDQHTAFWRQAGGGPPPAGSLLVSLFAYENPAIGELLRLWQNAQTPVCCLAPLSRPLKAIESYAGHRLRAGDVVRRGVLEIRLLPFLEQSVYDHLLWLCDVNFVRGEDSFVRAQWAARSMVWHIYPQHEGAHLAKLDAFLNLYCTDLPAASATAVREFWQAWNVGHVDGAHWQNFALCLPTLREHARRWQEALAREDDLSTRLLRFARSRL
ncbi:elongation factor P maturation arginine rhamnosyltransferase EarP [Accumulibacter sp.]|uniref:elongation factor P maturation arginine rhamnosyltransferase EarP n=1 Tax=Accumulibacter sp. TaxID=2053492 RepID=UPI0035AE76A9